MNKACHSVSKLQLMTPTAPMSTTSMKTRNSPGCAAFLAALSLLLAATPLQAEPAGTVIATDGTVFVLKEDGKTRIVSPGSTIAKGDSIQTEHESSAKVRFADNSEVTIRPASSLRIQEYHYQPAEPGKDSFALELFRGAIRQITGLIGKRGNQNAYRLQSGPATIGIRGTDFMARVCQGSECQGEEAGGHTTRSTATPVIGRVAEKKGLLKATAADGSSRELADGGAIYESDFLETSVGGYAAIVMTDRTRLVLPPDSGLKVTSYRYAEKEPEKGNLFFNLVRGGLRVVSGLIGKAAPSRVNIGTTTATIGIRGTSFDLVCVPANIPNPEGYGGGSTSCAGGGLYTATREGAITVTTEDGNTTVFGADENGYLPAANRPPILIRFAPEFLKTLPGPLPEKLQIDIEGLFGADGENFGESGLYVTVVDGKILLVQADRELLLGVGESGYAPANGLPPILLNTPPSFVSQDTVQTQQGIGYQGCKM